MLYINESKHSFVHCRSFAAFDNHIVVSRKQLSILFTQGCGSLIFFFSFLKFRFPLIHRGFFFINNYQGIIRFHGGSIFLVFLNSSPSPPPSKKKIHSRRKQCYKELSFWLKLKKWKPTHSRNYDPANKQNK